MTEPQTITVDHLRQLLAASRGSFLGLLGGEVEVVDGGDEGGALEVVTATDLRARVGDDPDEDALRSEAASLTVAVQHLGG